MCDLCSFWVGSALFCPECLSSGPSADERSSVTLRGFLSLGLAVLALVTLVADFAVVRLVSPSTSHAVDLVLSKASIFLGLGGLALGLIAREGARRTGSMLPLIGVVMNAVGVCVVTVFTLLALFQG
jgi:hypothetical protein